MSKLQSNIIVYDVGSTYTKATAFHLQGETLECLGRAQAPTSLSQVQTGLDAAQETLERSGICFTSDLRRYSTCSAAGGLRMVAMGFMPQVTVKAAKEVAMNAGARVLEVLSRDAEPEYRLQVLKEIRPDIILLAGGTNGGDTASAIENAGLIAQATVGAVVIVACNIEAQPAVRRILTYADIAHIPVPNVMPTIHELSVHAARAAIHEQFIRQITRAKGLGELQNSLTDKRVMPTPGAVLLATELLAKGTYSQEGLGGLVVMDIGGATTDIHSVLPHLDDLSSEERGLVVNNEKQCSYRTVEGNLGMRVSASGILEAVGEKALLRRMGSLSGKVPEDGFARYTAMLEQDPEHLCSDDTERQMDTAMAISALDVALKRHAGYLAQRYDAVMGIVPGYPIGRDLRKVEKVLAVGGIFTHGTPAVRQEIIRGAFADPGISLLPESPAFAVDRDYVLYAIGVLAQYMPEAAFDFGKRHFEWT